MPETLRPTAELRMANPEMSLEEIGALCDPAVGKSGVYHRLKKIIQLAETERNMN